MRESRQLVSLSVVALAGLLKCVVGVCPEVGIHAIASDKTTWPPGFEVPGTNITLDFPLLLDVETPRLSGLQIVSGGRLVFSQAAVLTKLVTDYVVIKEGGSLEIGSEECPFEGKAEILLTGKRGSYNSIDGEKYISVHKGGRLEIHGKPKKSWTKLSKTVLRGGGERTIHLMDEVTSWQRGDELVLASTDFDLNQAEVVTVKDCEKNSCIVDGLVRYDHFGEIDTGVDMRGEVGLLSRNVLIHGEMEESCYGEQLCNHFDYDTFGGHIIAREGFASFKVENAELTRLGQQGIVARYPLHWHMARNVSADTSYVRSNSIHHTLQRCVTCHGSFGCVIEDNMAFESLGHCYFMEDGVEKGTIMTGNLGLNTRKGFMIPSDADPATFWITHPDSYITGNTAGGSEGKGFWFLQASLPTGVSSKLQESGSAHFFDKDQLYRTKIGTISGNNAHSSSFGFFFDSILLPDQGAGSKNSGKFSPKEDPTDPESSDLTTSISDITCYKALETCVWMHLPRGSYFNMRIADSSEGMFVHEISNVNNSLLVGESQRNFGFPNRGVDKGLWYRSMPRSRTNIGFRNYVNPTLIENSVFVSFKDSATQVSRAIGVRAISSRSILTGASNITFVSTPFAARFLENKQPAREFLYKDYTGSISTFPDTYLVQNFSHLTSAKCVEFPEGGSVSVCPHKYVSFPLGGMGQNISLIRTDEPASVFTPLENENMFFLSADHTYIISFNGGFPFKRGRKLQIFANLFISGVDLGYNFVLGLCVPLDSEITTKRHTKVSSIDQVRNDTSGTAFFHDTSVGLVFFSFKGTYERKYGDTDPCGFDQSACLFKKIFFEPVGDNLSADCSKREDIFPKYQDLPLDGTGALARPQIMPEE